MSIIQRGKRTAAQAFFSTAGAFPQAIRAIRRDANDAIKKAKKDGELTEDDQKKQEDQAQKATDSFIKDIDKIIADKEKEIMTV